MSTGPIFIVGVPRSGTTLMRAVLSAHRNITIAPETFFLDTFAPFVNDDVLDAASFDEFWTKFTGDVRFSEFNVDAAHLAAAIKEAGKYDLKDIFRMMLQEYARKMGKPRWGEKTPEHYRHLKRLFEWFPDAHVIYMVRDPRAVCASLLSVPWRRRAPSGWKQLEPNSIRRSRRLHHDAIVWRNAHCAYNNNWHNDSRVMIVRYEDLVQDPARCSVNICASLGEPYDPAMVSSRSWKVVPPPPRTNGSRMTTWRYQHVGRTLGTITTDAMCKWRDELTAWEVSLIEYVCGDIMQTWSYDLEHGRDAVRMLSGVGAAALAGVSAVRRMRHRTSR